MARDAVLNLIKAINDGVGQLPSSCFSEGLTICINTHANTVFTQGSSRVRVISSNIYRDIEWEISGLLEPIGTGPAQLREPFSYSPAQLSGCLASKGESQDLLRGDDPIDHQPEHTLSHGFGLARAGASNND